MSRIARSSAPSSAAMATGAVIVAGVVGGIVIGLTGMTSMIAHQHDHHQSQQQK